MVATSTAVLTVDPEGIPDELKALPQWVDWKHEHRGGRPTKVPYTPDGRHASVDDPSTWSSFEDAYTSYTVGGYDGIGFVFADGGGLVGIDFDACRNPTTGEIEYWAQPHLDEFPSFTEVSPTGTGVHVIVKGDLPTEKTGARTGDHNRPPGPEYGGKKPGVEVYQRGRYLCMTGHMVPDARKDLVSFNGELHDWFGRVFTEKHSHQSTTSGSSRSDYPGDDRKLIERAKAYLRKLPPAVSGARGHDRAFHAACVLRCEFGLGFGAAWEAIQDWNTTCDPPWSEPELRRKLDEAAKEPVTNRLRDAEKPGSTFDGGDRYTRNGAGAAETSGTSAPRQKIRRLTLRELRAEYPELKSPVIGHLLRVAEVMNVVAPPKRGKSWLVAQLVISVAMGLAWLGMFPTRKSKVLLIDNELYPELIRSRIVAVAEAMGVSLELLNDAIVTLPLRGNLLSIDQLDAELDDIAEGEYGLIVIDARYRMQIEKGEDENDNASTARFFNKVDALARRLGCAVVLIHHSTKGDQSGKSVVDIGAGGGSQSRAADTHLILRDHEEEGAVVMEAVTRSFKPMEPVCLRWTWPLWQTDDQLDAKALKGRKSANEERTTVRDQETDKAILAKCAEWTSRSQLRTATGFGADRLNRGICRLLEASDIEQSEEERRGNPCEVFRRTQNAD